MSSKVPSEFLEMKNHMEGKNKITCQQIIYRKNTKFSFWVLIIILSSCRNSNFELKNKCTIEKLIEPHKICKHEMKLTNWTE